MAVLFKPNECQWSVGEWVSERASEWATGWLSEWVVAPHTWLCILTLLSWCLSPQGIRGSIHLAWSPYRWMAVKPANTPPIMSAAKAVKKERMSTATGCLSQAFFQGSACVIGNGLKMWPMNNATYHTHARIVALYGCWTCAWKIMGR